MAAFQNLYEKETALVVDVNSSMRQIIASMLRTIGFKYIFVATNEVQATEILAIEKITIVISGWLPGKLDGLRILERVRQNKKTSALPFLMVTDLIDQELVKQAVINGVSEYIVPPFNKQILQKRLERALKIPIHSSAENVIKKDQRTRFTNKNNTKDLNILIVDDVPDNIEIIRGILKPYYKLRAVTSGKSVMKICQSNQPPDMILLDIMMPEVDGLTVCRELKKNPMTQNIVVIFLTALSESKDIVKGLELGAVDYITKPIQPDVVLARVNTHSKLVVAQRAVQNQIDQMIKDNKKRDQLNTIYQRQLQDLNNTAVESTKFLESKLKGTNVVDRAFEQLKYSVNFNQLLVNNLNTLPILENNSYKINRSRKETSNFIKRLIQVFQFEIKEKNLEIKLMLDCETPLFIDENLTNYILFNLLSNAIKYSPRGSQIHIKTQELEQHILISMQNVGEIDEKVKDNFFQLFVSSENEGDGIGAYASFLAARAMHSQLYYHTSEQYGTIFYLKIRK